MISIPSSDFVPLSAEVAADFLKRGGWSKKEAVLILNGLDPRKNAHHLEFDNDDFRVDPMLGTYLTAIDVAFPKMQVLSVGDVLAWATVGTKQHPRRQPLTLSRELQAAIETSNYKLLERRIRHAGITDGIGEPWWVIVPTDPEPKYPWYTAARYFARKLISSDPVLASKRNLLAQQVQQLLADHGIYKRGGKQPPIATTILNALSGVDLKG